MGEWGRTGELDLGFGLMILADFDGLEAGLSSCALAQFVGQQLLLRSDEISANFLL
jgi:hypothetical protein